MGEETLCNRIEVVRVALVIPISTIIRIIEETDCANFITDSDDGLTTDLADLNHVIVATVLLSDVLDRGKRSETFT